MGAVRHHIFTVTLEQEHGLSRVTHNGNTLPPDERQFDYHVT